MLGLTVWQVHTYYDIVLKVVHSGTIRNVRIRQLLSVYVFVYLFTVWHFITYLLTSLQWIAFWLNCSWLLFFNHYPPVTFYTSRLLFPLFSLCCFVHTQKCFFVSEVWKGGPRSRYSTSNRPVTDRLRMSSRAKSWRPSVTVKNQELQRFHVSKRMVPALWRRRASGYNQASWWAGNCTRTHTHTHSHPPTEKKTPGN